MIITKHIFTIFVLCLLSYSVVESCNSNSGTSGADCSANSVGLLGTCTISSNCCNTSNYLTCIDGKCQCNLNALGGFDSYCSSDCPCKTNGLICVNSKCVCNSTVALWDNDRCVTFATSALTCDGLIGTLTNAGTSPFGTAATNWKCTSDGYVYAPSYNALTKKGKFFIKPAAENGASSFSSCKNLGAIRFQPATTDDIYTQVFPKYTITLNAANNIGIWIGAFLDPRYNDYYWDNGSKLDSRAPAVGASCVVASVSNAGAITFNANVCTDSFKTLCVF